jgi:DNA-directed RNA polymerase subunit RPC12/RpoP
MEKYINANELLHDLPDDLPYKGSVRRVLMQAPTADVVEVKHGEWIWLEGNLYECSECPNKTEVDEKMNQPSYAYCPYCGAKMDGERKHA